jgi:hypothetical protein
MHTLVWCNNRQQQQTNPTTLQHDDADDQEISNKSKEGRYAPYVGSHCGAGRGGEEKIW